MLLRIKGIVDAAVIGIHHEYAGEVPMALVVKEEEADIFEDDIKKFVSGIKLSNNLMQFHSQKQYFRTVNGIEMVARRSEIYRQDSQDIKWKNIKENTKGTIHLVFNG